MNKETLTMQKCMSKSEVRCASLLNNILDENINIKEILDKIKLLEQCNIRPGVGKIEFTIYVIGFVHNKTMDFVNSLDDNKKAVVQNMFNVPEVESPTIKKIPSKTSTPNKSFTNQNKKTVQIHALTSKNLKTKSICTTTTERKKLDLLGNLYAVIIDSNILCNLFHELSYVFTLLTVKNPEKTFNNNSFNSNANYFKSSDDCHYFASKTIQHLVSILAYLERPIINLILKQRIINVYIPEFIKTLESKLVSTSTNLDNKPLSSNVTKGMVKFDGEHDTKDCFPTLKMFHAFKSQRDAFYELLENWKQHENELNPKKSEYILKMLNEHNGSFNMSKFTKLFVTQLVNSSFEESKNIYTNETIKELSASKLELLHQRITKRDYTSGYCVNPANEFPGVQIFFKKFATMLSSNGIFCKHLIDTLVHRIDVLNKMEWATELQEGAIYQQTYLYYVDSLKLLAKFLGFVLYYPYKDVNVVNPASKEYLWDIRSKVLPPLNLLDKLNSALKQGYSAIVLTMSWTIEYLYQVDKITITTPFYTNILTWLYSLCTLSSVTTGSVLMLKLQFNRLIEFISISPHLLFNESTKCIDKNLVSNVFKELKSGPLVNTKQIYHYCPQLSNFRTILECTVSNKKIKFIAPKFSSPSRKINQNRQVEMELESHFFENHSPSVLTTVDFVAKRVASSCTKMIQNKGMLAVKNLFVDIVCEKFQGHITNEEPDAQFKINENDVAKCSAFLNSTIQQYIDKFSKNNIPNSIKELLDSDTVNPGSLPFCIAVTICKFKALVTEWVKNHINIKNFLITYINTELKHNFKTGKINEDGSNLRELMLPTNICESDEDLFIPDNELLLDLNVFSLKVIEIDDCQLTLDNIFDYAIKFKIILENKTKMNSSLYKFMVTRLIDNILLATYNMPKLVNSDVMKAYYPYFTEKLYTVSMIICERNIYVLSEKSNSHKAIVSEKITAWLQFFIEKDLLTIDELTNQIMSILRISWPEDTLKCLSICFKDLNGICLKKFDDTKVKELFMWLTHFIDVIEDYNVEF